MQEFRLPDLGEGMQEAEIRRWLVKPGDTIKLDQPMVEVETDKAVIEIPSPVSGRIADIYVQEGTTAKLGEVLVTFETSSNGSKTSLTTNSHDSKTQRRILAAPAVRKRAFEMDIDLEQVPPSQPNGRVTMEDVLVYAERLKQEEVTPSQQTTTTSSYSARNAAARGYATRHLTERPPLVATRVATREAVAAEERQPLTGLRKRIAERMEHSWRTVPHATAFDELDGTELVALRRALKPIVEQRGMRLTYMPLLVKLLLPVLKELPIFNASLDEERREIVYKRQYHIGVATAAPEGLLVPALRNADQLTIWQIAQQLEYLIEGAQKRTLTRQEVSGSTFTLNNVGSFGGSGGTPIINYPEVAILAVGRLQEKAIVRNGAIIACSMMPLALSFDHRLIDGALAGQFLARFKELVEHPQQLMLDML